MSASSSGLRSCGLPSVLPEVEGKETRDGCTTDRVGMDSGPTAEGRRGRERGGSARGQALVPLSSFIITGKTHNILSLSARARCINLGCTKGRVSEPLGCTLLNALDRTEILSGSCDPIRSTLVNQVWTKCDQQPTAESRHTSNSPPPHTSPLALSCPTHQPCEPQRANEPVTALLLLLPLRRHNNRQLHGHALARGICRAAGWSRDQARSGPPSGPATADRAPW